jgi:replicative DNA helicase
LENEADIVCFLYRPEYYGITEDEEGNPTQGIGEVIIAKHRNGSMNAIGLKFIGKYMKFMDRDGFDYASFGSLPGSSSIPLEFNESNTIKLGQRKNVLPPGSTTHNDELPPF